MMFDLEGALLILKISTAVVLAMVTLVGYCACALAGKCDEAEGLD